MSKFTLRNLCILAMLLPLAACGGNGSSGGGNNGGGGGTTPANNVLPVVSNLGPTAPASPYANGLFASVTICAPGTSNCQTIDNVLVDTGSYGLRLLDTADSTITVPLPMAQAPSGDPLDECTAYVSTFNWGPVATADVKLAGETASSVPIQLMGASSSPAAPAACAPGSTEQDTLALLGANGILGLGVFQYDCGPACTPQQTANPPTTPPVYFACPSSGCVPTLVPLAQEVQNPIPLFAQDNNGLLIQMPSVPAQGAASVDGSLIFGIGTQNNNAITGGAVLGADNYGDFATDFEGNPYCCSVIDSGSNANFFLDATTLSMPTCADAPGFYCPTAPQPISYTATNISADGLTTATATWTVANADTLFNSGNAAFDNLAGPNANAFDFGLSFFFGKTVYVGINGATATSNGVTYAGPFYGY